MIHQTKRLLVTSGDGPEECRLFVSRLVALIEREAGKYLLEITALEQDLSRKEHPVSVVIEVQGKAVDVFIKRWVGTVKWTCKSPFRPNHKRQNWFVGVFELPDIVEGCDVLDESDLTYQSFRADGPGGQHQNTTNSAVRVIHVPTGTVAVSRDERSQHRNKQTARQRLAEKLRETEVQSQALSKSMMATLHKSLERGNPVRCFKGSAFKEIGRK